MSVNNTINDEIKNLFDQKSLLYESDENKRRLQMWGPDICPDEYLPGIIAPIPTSERKEKRVPITADWDRIQKAKLLKFDIIDYYKNPRQYLKWNLKIDIHRFLNFPDDTPLLKNVPIFLGIAFEPSLFGVEVIYSKDHEPLFTSEGAVIKTRKDFSKIPSFNFYTSGLMPLAHKFYEILNTLVPKDYQVIFHKWDRAPLGVACGMRGMENLLMDMVEEPKFVHQLMKMITETRKEFTRERRKLIGKEEIESSLANDEASCPIISPRMYEEFCFPYEDDLARFYGNIRWWHSCGSKSSFISTIKKISCPVGVIDLNWWNDDFYKAIKELHGIIPYHIRLGENEIMQSNPDIIRNTINAILSITENDNCMFRIDGYQPSNPTEEDVHTMKKFINLVKEISEKKVGY
jgi:uroporphyrinogen-III decarboxylase